MCIPRTSVYGLGSRPWGSKILDCIPSDAGWLARRPGLCTGRRWRPHEKLPDKTVSTDRTVTTLAATVCFAQGGWLGDRLKKRRPPAADIDYRSVAVGLVRSLFQHRSVQVITSPFGRGRTSPTGLCDQLAVSNVTVAKILKRWGRGSSRPTCAHRAAGVAKTDRKSQI